MFRSSREDILSALDYIPVADLSYEEWTKVGMALKDASENGEDVYYEDFDLWSQNDDRYKQKDCKSTWDSFKRNDGKGITISTLFYMAQDFGYIPKKQHESKALEWNSIIDDGIEDIENRVSIEATERPWEIREFIETLFRPEDNVWFNLLRNKTVNESGKIESRMGKGCRRKAKDILKELKEKKPIDEVFTSYETELGGYVHFNPLDDNGVTDNNVVEYRYCLVEGDEISKNEQLKIIKELQLPCATIVDSGGKSIHAVVKVNAKDYNEYKKCANKIYDELDEHGFKVDRQNINPSRMTRLPGLIRGNKVQKLIATNVGLPNYDEWLDYIDTEYLPSFTLDEFIENPPDKKPCQIEGFLRRGHKMIITGPSKAGKTQLLIELSIALAEGKKWLGKQCAKGKVLYANLEIDQSSFIDRFKKVYDALNIKPENAKNICILPLRGLARPIGDLSDILIKQFKDQGFDALIIDPLYKVQDGDENSAQDITKFTNTLDKISECLDLSVIYVHHHSKGPQYNKTAMDRGSGSGVFSRDADAIIDLIQVQSDQEFKAYRIESEVREFPDPDNIYVYWKHPIHEVETEGRLIGAKAVNPSKVEEDPPKKKKVERIDKHDVLEAAFNEIAVDDVADTNALANKLNIKPSTLRNRIHDFNEERNCDFVYSFSKTIVTKGPK